MTSNAFLRGRRAKPQRPMQDHRRFGFCCAMLIASAALAACDHPPGRSGLDGAPDAGLAHATDAAPRTDARDAAASCRSDSPATCEADAIFPWAAPGKVRWLIDYATMNRDQVQLMLDAKINLIQGGGFEPAALELIKQTPDAHAMQYICSRTIYHANLFPKHPALKTAAILNPDGSYKVIYNNPARYAGCWNQPAWVDYLKGRLDELEQAGVEAVFFDNPMTWACHCPRCQALFTQFAKEKTGRPLTLGQFGEPTELEHWFTIETALRFWRDLHAYARRKHLFMIANNLTYYLVDQGLVDGVFGEASAHPPFQQDVAAYKLGLAASRGKPTGILNYLPKAVLEQRGWQVPNTSQGSGQQWVGAPIAEEVELGNAMGLAYGGNYIVNASLELGRRLELLSDPEDTRIWAAVRSFGSFAKDHPELYAESQPGSTVAVLFSLSKGPREGELLGMNRASVNSLLAALNRQGIAAEVIVESDLTPSRLAGFKAVVVDDVDSLEPTAVAGLRQFAEAGGSLVFAAPGMVRERYAPAAEARSLGAFFPELQASASYRFEPRDATLDGYVLEGARAKVTTSGKATFRFAGAAGAYRLTVGYLDEHDGQGRYELLVDGRAVGSWPNNRDDDAIHEYVSPAVQLRPASTITVVGYAGGGEYARLYGLRADMALSEGSAVELRVGEGRAWQVARSLAKLTTAEGAAVWAALRALEPVTPAAAWPPKLSLNLTRAGKRGALCAHLVNSDFRYDTSFALQRIEPTGPVTLSVGKLSSARLLTPDGAPQTLPIKDGRVQVPAVRVYSVVVLE